MMNAITLYRVDVIFQSRLQPIAKVQVSGHAVYLLGEALANGRALYSTVRSIEEEYGKQDRGRSMGAAEKVFGK